MKRATVAFTFMLVLPGVALAAEEKRYEGLSYFLVVLRFIQGVQQEAIIEK